MLTRYEQGNLTWIDLVTPNETEVRALMHEFGLHPLVAQDLLAPSQKSKVERYDGIFYLVLTFPTLRGGYQARALQEIDFCLGKNFFITTRYENINPLHSFAKAFEAHTVLGGTGSQLQSLHIFSSMLRNLYQGLVAECDALGLRLAEIEEQIFKGDERSMVAKLSHVGRMIHDFRQALVPHREILRGLELPGEKIFGREFVYYLQGVVREHKRVEEALENLKETLGELRETNNSLLETKQNEIMKTLTVLAFIFLPLTFIGQIFGMSVPLPLAENPYSFWFVIGSMVIIAGAIFLYFKRRGWL
ncbi:MAG: magnesium transporter CorA family protein [Candidatus Adlerbacteria bacterium]|nr:magnesium transporter CorA family protein [Candidatus Adlerbacteria bacterium]